MEYGVYYFLLSFLNKLNFYTIQWRRTLRFSYQYFSESLPHKECSSDNKTIFIVSKWIRELRKSWVIFIEKYYIFNEVSLKVKVKLRES